jgi:hypothetical protein
VIGGDRSEGNWRWENVIDDDRRVCSTSRDASAALNSRMNGLD